MAVDADGGVTGGGGGMTDAIWLDGTLVIGGNCSTGELCGGADTGAWVAGFAP